MANELRIHCPKCSKSFKLKPEFAGRKVKCVQCATVFRVAASAAGMLETEKKKKSSPPARNPQPPLQPLEPLDFEPLQPVSSTQEPSHQEPLDPLMPEQMLPGTAEPLMPLSSGADPFSLPTSPDLSQQPSGTMLPKAKKPKPRKRKKKRAEQDLSETDQKVQGAGITMVGLTIASAVLPMFGLQLGRLRKLGEFAPLAGMFLGLIGVGCICYARRERKDMIPLSITTLVTVLMFGIGGYFFQSHSTQMPDDTVVKRIQNRPAKSAQEAMANHKAVMEQSRASIQEHRNQNRDRVNSLSNQTNRESSQINNEENDDNSLNAQRFQNNLEPSEERNNPFANSERMSSNPEAVNPFFADNSGNETTQSDPAQNPFAASENMNNSSVDGASDDTSSVNSSNPFASDSVGTETNSNPFAAADKNTDQLPFVESLQNSNTSEVLPRWGLAMAEFQKARMNKGNIGNGLKIEKSVGTRAVEGRLFASEKPIRGIEVFKVGSPAFVPIFQEESLSDKGIPYDFQGGQLTGFNLSLQEQKIVGIQGIYAAVLNGKRDLDNLSTGHWLGRQTNETIEVKTEKQIYGFATYGVLDAIGMSLITK